MGAWIETVMPAYFCIVAVVAPRVGAWIETSSDGTDEGTDRSHPEWVRGLKHLLLIVIAMMMCRTPSGCVD